MLFTENFLEQALAQVFVGKPAGASMTLADINSAWSSVGLRKSDLADALRHMEARQYLASDGDIDNPSFVLTERGAVHFYICLYCEDELQKRLAAQREVQDEGVVIDVPDGFRNRRSSQA